MQSPNKQPEEEFLQSQPQSSLAESLGKQMRLGFVALHWGSPWQSQEAVPQLV